MVCLASAAKFGGALGKAIIHQHKILQLFCRRSVVDTGRGGDYSGCVADAAAGAAK